MEAGINSDLESLLCSLRNDNVVYVPNAGNAGDAFIAHATYQMFSRIGLDFELGSLTERYPGRVIICGGGGNLVPSYGDMIHFIERNGGACKKLIILPHTIRAYGEALSQFGPNCYVFCRERPSFAYVKVHALRANVFLSHDLAISCDLELTRRQIQRRLVRDFINVRLVSRNAKRLARVIAYSLRKGVRWNDLNAFRNDIERTEIQIPSLNLDVSNCFADVDLTPLSSLYTTYWMMTFIDRFQVVRTNRLHVGIMAALLGKEVHLYDNSYGKVGDVFVRSMRERFPNVHWQGIA